ncbi:MAG: class I SAM-dependent methyltransferase [Bacteroidota bacterium]|nr:class I SAM-dependent methyltransferase [Bacteroidota bacterium]
MQKRHLDPLRYIHEQIFTTQKYIVPFIQQVKKIDESVQVLEIGCGEAGNLKPFLDLGCKCTGVDFSTHKIEQGREFFSTHSFARNIRLISEDIYETKEFHSQFDLIIVRDVIEHIHDQDKFLALMKDLLAPGGVAFFAFPPWQNPFGGHQQICESKLLSSLPYFHLLPVPLYRVVLKMFGEKEGKVAGLLEIKETGISLERFERLVIKNGYVQLKKILYFVNPNYEVKFGLKPRKLVSFLGKIPYLRNYFSTCGYYLISKGTNI